MAPQELKSLDIRLTQFLEDLLTPMGRSERRHWARVYIHGLLIDDLTPEKKFTASKT